MKKAIQTRSERRGYGKSLRDECSRAEHSVWKKRSSKTDVIEWLEESNRGRIKGLIPVRYGRMAASPLHFFRGTAIIQARDIANGPSPGIETQLCGDCHLSNFGGFATPERSLAFDINDFDETLPGPFEWDLKRLTASLVVAARYLGFPDAVGTEAVRACVRSYRERMDGFAKMTRLEQWYARITMEDLLAHFRSDKDATTRLGKRSEEARSRTSEAVFPKLTQLVDGVPRIVDDPPLIYHFQHAVKDLAAARQKLLSTYRNSLISDRRVLFDRYTLVDSAMKVVGVGSVGTRCLVSLFMADDEDPLFLQIKEARRSVLEPSRGKSRFAHQGERIVSGQRLMQAATDIFIGWTTGPEDRHYFVRQLRDQKVSADIESFKRKTLVGYATICGWALARAHAKASDPVVLAGYLGSGPRLDEALATYAVAYADQVDADFEVFTKAIRSGRLRTDTSTTVGVEFNL